MIDSTNPRILADNIRDLTDKQIVEAAEILALQGDFEALGSYSTTEVNTGKKWIDNSGIFRKVFVVEAFPNNTAVNIAHNITNLGSVVSLFGIMYNIDSTAGRPFTGGVGSPQVAYNDTNLILYTNSDLSGRSGVVIMEYTKSAAPTSDLSPAPDDTRSIEPEEREEEPIIDEPIEEPVVEVKKTTRKKTTTE